MALTVELTKRYGDFTLDVAFSTNGGVLSLFGASGSGKSLTLRCIAGVVRPDRGHIELDGTVLFDSKRGINLPPQRRGVGYLFQNYALFPTMTAAKNIETGLMHVRDRKRRAEQAEALLAAYRLTAQADLYPHQLSGGQQQRVALARALATNPRALLLDEPFSALDNHLRWQLEQELVDTIETFPGTTLFISHSVGEVYRLADRVCVLENGKSRMAADKAELLLRPRTLSDALLVGLQNYSCADRDSAHTMYARAWGVTLRAAHPIPEDATAVGIRAADIRPGCANEGNALCCTVQRVTEDVETRVVTLLPKGAGAHMRSRLRMELEKDAPCPFVTGQEACVVLPEDAILCFREERG